MAAEYILIVIALKDEKDFKAVDANASKDSNPDAAATAAILFYSDWLKFHQLEESRMTFLLLYGI